MRSRIYLLLEGARAGWVSSSISQALSFLIIVNLVEVALETVPSLATKYSILFQSIEYFSLVVFSVEYFLRLWTCVEHPLFKGTPLLARLRYAVSANSLIDLISVAPFWFAFLMPSEWRVLLVFRVVRLLKLGRYSPAMRSLLDAVYNERRALWGCFIILLGAALLSGTALYLIERGVQPDRFGSIPAAMWWAIVTLGTIGYGDVVPVTVAGRFVATVTIFEGLILVSLPIGIIATAFANDVHRRDFIVTWAMVARVPLFSELSAAQIADVMRLLRSQHVDAGTFITRRGEAAHSMYFVHSGEVDLDVDDKRFRLRPGHFFGERAILKSTRRMADALAIARTSLLVLDGKDLRILMERQPSIAKRVRDIAMMRSGEQFTEIGDLVAEELTSERSKDPSGGTAGD
jgi:voltage-gated potassium channel